MDDRTVITRLHRRGGFGLATGELEAALERGVSAEIDRLIDPDGAGIGPSPDPWHDDELAADTKTVGLEIRKRVISMIDGWLTRMVTSPRPLADRTTWFWHGHFVSSIGKVKAPLAMAKQLRLFQDGGLGSFDALVRAVTVDPAMLVYLDGVDSKGDAPNENYSREVMELFTLGRGNYTEADIGAGAVALTGWRLDGNRYAAATKGQFLPRRHDDTAQIYLGREGVHDVDSVIDALMAQPTLPKFVAGKVARAIIGPSVDEATVTELAAGFRDTGFDIGKLMNDVLHAVANGVDGGPVVLAPVPWLVAAQRATGATLAPAVRLDGLRSSGQVPCNPPNVAGWPGSRAWFGSATVVGRFNLASLMSQTTAEANPCYVAASAGDAAGLALALGLPTSFGSTTTASLAAVDDPKSRLVIALTAPEFVLS